MPEVSQGGKGQLGVMATDTVKESDRLKLPSGEKLIYCPVLTLLWQEGSCGAKLLFAYYCYTERIYVCAVDYPH